MAWTPPTVADFKTRFPQFASIPDATVQAILDEAIPQVGETWLERDRTPGVLHLTAHLIASQGIGVTVPGGGPAVTGAVKRRKVGDVEVEFAGTAGSAGATGLAAYYLSTSYGNVFYQLLRKNFPAVAVV
jgi:hypothetical protein